MRGLKVSACALIALALLWLCVRVLLGPFGAIASLNYRAFTAVVALAMACVFALLGAVTLSTD